MKILIAGGGTGGHIFPALAIAEEISTFEKKENILFVGTKRGLERKLVPQAGYDIKFIDVKGIKRTGIKNLLQSFYQIPVAILQSARLIISFKPDFVLGTGGYASGPTLMAAVLLFKKSGIMEQNSVPGLTNRILSKFVKLIFISYTNNLKYFSEKKSFLTGNPVSKSFLTNLRQKNIQNNKVFTVTVLGGSQGSRMVNYNFFSSIKYFSAKEQELEIIHQCGEYDYNDLKKKYCDVKYSHTLKPFFKDMAEIYLKSDLLISRAGAMTISEIQIAGKPSILIPLSTATDNHQEINASELVSNNAAVMIKEKDLTPQILAKKINSFFIDLNKLELMATRALENSKPDASGKIYLEIMKALN